MLRGVALGGFLSGVTKVAEGGGVDENWVPGPPGAGDEECDGVGGTGLWGGM